MQFCRPVIVKHPKRHKNLSWTSGGDERKRILITPTAFILTLHSEHVFYKTPSNQIKCKKHPYICLANFLPLVLQTKELHFFPVLMFPQLPNSLPLQMAANPSVVTEIYNNLNKEQAKCKKCHGAFSLSCRSYMQKKPYLYFGLNLPVRSISGCATP